MPTIHLEACTKCMKCVKDCPSNAIDIHKGYIASSCIHCGHCVAICPESTISPDSGDVIPLKPQKISAGDFENFTAALRSIRYYKKQEIEEDILQKLVENMKNYASASNARPVKLTIVRSPEKIQQLNDQTLDTLISQIAPLTNPVLGPIISLLVPKINVKLIRQYKASFVERRKTNSSLVCHHAPAVILFHGPASKLGMAETDACIWATQTTMYAKTLGLGSCFIGFIVKAMERSKRMKKEMGVPANHKVFAALILGYPKVTYKNESSRKPPGVKWV